MNDADLTASLISHIAGDENALHQIIPIVYDELKAMASKKMSGERVDHSLSSTGLLHEVFARLIDTDRVDWQGRTHFCAVCAETMRRVLIDHARSKARVKRGGDNQQVTLDEAILDPKEDYTLVELDDALTRLESLSERQAQVVKLRFFGGLTIEETAAVLEVAAMTVKNDWQIARAWLKKWMKEGRDKPAGAN